jgi:hypothetical protein
VGAVFGPGCDGELSVPEVLERIAEVAAAGGLLGAWGLTPAVTDRLAAAVEEVPTEASAQAVHCARGRTGPSPMRGGRRSVELSPVGAVTFFFSPSAAMDSAARLSAAVAGCRLARGRAGPSGHAPACAPSSTTSAARPRARDLGRVAVGDFTAATDGARPRRRGGGARALEAARARLEPLLGVEAGEMAIVLTAPPPNSTPHSRGSPCTGA